MTPGLLLQAIVVVMAAAILARVEPILNRMNSRTPLRVSLGYVLVFMGAAANFLIVIGGRVPEISEVALISGIAFVIVFNRRRKSL